ncbi:unnamed protein product [Polarella glacialis]|uniref:50S ribosomal protein L17 n=1 Tax=Polarella glacialis TaxID=89957 RepID=A0A813JH25_POLGL|nr:unnamed protein product [Polarella glacialis]
MAGGRIVSAIALVSVASVALSRTLAFSIASPKPQLPALRAATPLLRVGAEREPKLLQGPDCSRFSLVTGCVALVFAAARGLSSATSGRDAATGLTTMFFKKRYGGGPVKKDPDAEFGPQYDGPPIHYQIQRGPRLGFPKGGEQRVIPKLSGGSYDNRKRMMQNLTTELVRHGRIKTTRARAEALCFFVDRMILLAKRGDDLARREADEWMFDEKLVENLFKLAPERYPDQTKDFCKVTRTMNRKGDYSEMAYIELL